MPELDHYDIMICPTDTYFLQAMVVMQSALLNCRKNVHFYVLNSDWTEEHKQSVYELVAKYPGNKVDFVKVDNEPFKNFSPWRNCQQSYYKILSHWYLPQELERVLFLDCDTIINKDISNFYNMEFDGNYIIASTETLSMRKYNYLLSIGIQKRGIFNAGVMLLNLTALRKDNITLQTYLDAIEEMGDDKYFADQGLLCYMFKDKTKIIPSYKYNHVLFQVGNDTEFTYTYDTAFAMSDEQKAEALTVPYRSEKFNEAENESIIHFAGPKLQKPWDCDIELNGDKITVTKIPRLELTNLDFPTARRYYDMWWDIAKNLPSKLLVLLMLMSQSNCLKIVQQELSNSLKFTVNIREFLYKICIDDLSARKFESFLKTLDSKKIAVLKSADIAGKLMLQAAETYNAQVVFSTPKRFLKDLTREEWQCCKQADVVICCNVHGAKPEVREGVKTVVITDLV